MYIEQVNSCTGFLGDSNVWLVREICTTFSAKLCNNLKVDSKCNNLKVDITPISVPFSSGERSLFGIHSSPGTVARVNDPVMAPCFYATYAFYILLFTCIAL